MVRNYGKSYMARVIETNTVRRFRAQANEVNYDQNKAFRKRKEYPAAN
jgi:hypothetical protein